MSKTSAEKWQQRVGLLDMDSKEILDDGRLVYIPRKVRIKEGWFMAMQDGFRELAKKPVRGESMRVLCYLMSCMEFENVLPSSQSEIATALAIKPQNVSRSIKELRERKILIEGERQTLLLDPMFGWRGKVTNLQRLSAQKSANFSSSRHQWKTRSRRKSARK